MPGPKNIAATDRARSPRPRVSRRRALQQLGWVGALAGLNWAEESAPAASLPEERWLTTDPEKYWARLRAEQFLLSDDRVFLNPGSLGVMPRPVLEAVTASLQRAAEYPTDDIERWGYETLESERTEMAEFLGCRKEELAFTHNCTEAMSTLANGLDLKPGDEVLMTNQEHPSGSSPWRLKAARMGISVREVEIPLTPKEPGELLEPLTSALGPRTRVLVFSGITSPTGLCLPVSQLCQAARERGVLSVVDGAHMDGQVHVDLHQLGCDYFVGSPHKWMFAPAGCGLFYGRGDALDRIWPTVVTVGWDNKQLGAARFMMIGTNNRATIHGMIAGLRFFKEVGPERIYARTHQLAQMVLAQARTRSYFEPVTSEDSQFFHGMVSLRCKLKNLDGLSAALRKNRINVVGGQRFRVSTQIHARPSDIEKLFEVCDSVA